jgi:hypothetical protein
MHEFLYRKHKILRSLEIHGNDGSSSLACLAQRWEGICVKGAIGLLSFSALILKSVAQSPPITTKAMPVFLCQLFGVAHHPPAGDQTLQRVLGMQF